MSSLRSADAFERLIDSLLDAAHPRNPWRDASTYEPDFALLERLLSIPVRQGAGQQTGRLARATDAWTAQELRCAGFGEHEVWPRRVQPRVLPQSLAEAFELAERPGAKVLAGGQSLIPSLNMDALMLRQDVVDAVHKGEFHIYAIDTVEEGIELLTGRPAGRRRADGSYPPDSVHGLVAARLAGYAEKLRAFAEADGDEAARDAAALHAGARAAGT